MLKNPNVRTKSKFLAALHKTGSRLSGNQHFILYAFVTRMCWIMTQIV